MYRHQLMDHKFFKLLLIFFVVALNSLTAQINFKDPTFNTSSGTNSTIYSLALQADNKILIGGSFTTFNGISTPRVTRLNSDGTLDSTFNIGSGPDGAVMSISIQQDSKIIISGFFKQVNGISSRSIARLNSDGTIDTTFNIGSGADSTVFATKIQADGKIIIGGRFQSFNGIPANYVLRLNTGGDIDTSFSNLQVDSSVFAISIQPDNKIIIGGEFKHVNGLSKNSLARLNQNGSNDSNFNIGIGFNQQIRNVLIQPDGKVLTCGGFTALDGNQRKYIARLNSNGSLDINFDPGISASDLIETIALQPNGKIFVGGYFNYFNGVFKKFISKLNNDGTVDPYFLQGEDVNSYVYASVVQQDGKIIAAGSFEWFGTVKVFNIIRFINDNALGYNEFDKGTKFEVYPIPANNVVCFSSNDKNKNGTLSIFNMNGELVYKDKISSNFLTLNTMAWSNGIYLANYKGANYSKTIKFNIENQ